MNIAICDDEQYFIDDLREKLTAYQIKSDREFTIFPFTNLNELLPKIDLFSIIFLDIRFNGRTIGIEWARALRNSGNDIPIILCSSLKDQILNGYDIGAMNFLLKPVSKQALIDVLDDCFHRIKTSPEKVIVKTIKEETIFITISNILYIKSETPVRTVYLKDGRKVVTRQQLKQFSKLLIETKHFGERFAYAHRSFIINIAEIDSIVFTHVTVTSGVEIPITRGKYLSLRKEIIDFVGGCR